MSNPGAEALQALINYSNEITGESNTTLSDAVETLVAGYGGSSIKTGSFVGNGTSTLAIYVGFAPDVFVIDSDVDYSEAGWSGVGTVMILKGRMTVIQRHNNVTATSAISVINPITNDYGEDDVGPNYSVNGSYDDQNGILTLRNKNENTSYSNYYKNREYTWYAVKFN